MILGITATRGKITKHQADVLEEWCNNPRVTEVHHGDCVGGEVIAHIYALKTEKKIIIHPPVKEKLRAFCGIKIFKDQGDVTILEPRLYMERNHDVVHACDFLLALPGTDHEIVRSGTWATIRYARRIARGYQIVLPSEL